MTKAEGIYSPALRTRTVGTYKAPTSGQLKSMLKAEGIKYKDLSNKDIIAKATRLNELKTITKGDLVAAGVTGVALEKMLGIVDKAKEFVKNITTRKDRPELKTGPRFFKKIEKDKGKTEGRPNVYGRKGGKIKSKYSTGGGVRKSKYSL